MLARYEKRWLSDNAFFIWEECSLTANATESTYPDGVGALMSHFDVKHFSALEPGAYKDVDGVRYYREF